MSKNAEGIAEERRQFEECQHLRRMRHADHRCGRQPYDRRVKDSVLQQDARRPQKIAGQIADQ